jgi:hypothetical protein
MMPCGSVIRPMVRATSRPSASPKESASSIVGSMRAFIPMPTPKNMYEHACSRVGWGGEGDWDMAIVGGTHELRESVRARVRERARARGHTCSRMVGSSQAKPSQARPHLQQDGGLKSSRVKPSQATPAAGWWAQAKPSRVKPSHTCSRMVGSVHGEEPETAVDELAFLVGGALGATLPLISSLISSTSFMKHSEKKKPRSCQNGQVRVP